MGKYVLNCDYCKNEYFVKKYIYENAINNKNKNHVCSKACADEMNKIRAEKKRKLWPFIDCDYCGKSLQVSPAQYKIKMKNINFIACSRECSQKLLGEKHKRDGEKRHEDNWEKFNCIYCGKEFLADFWKAKTARFCSSECQGKFKTESATIKLNCQYCGKEFNALRGENDFFHLKYCSKECRNDVRKKRVYKNCIICGKEYWQHLAYSHTSICCSKKCQHIWLKEYSNRPEVKERLKIQGTNSVLKMKKEYTLPELLVLEYLVSNNIEFIPQCPIGEIFVVDFFLPKYNCILEVYGDYWHANPMKYGEGLKELTDRQIKQKRKDVLKQEKVTKEYNYNFYYIWEYDIKNNLEYSMNKFFKYINSKIRRESVV